MESEHVNIDNLIEHSIATFKNTNHSSVQTSARKVIESFCKILILEHFKSTRGNQIICSQDDEWNSELKIYRSNIKNGYELVLQKMLEVIVKSDIIDDCYKKKKNLDKNGLSKTIRAKKEQLKSYINLLKFSGNTASHESTIIVMDKEDVIMTQSILKKLLNWLFIEFLEVEIPARLMYYIGTYDIFISYRHTESEWIKILIENLKREDYSVFEDNYQGGGGKNNKTFLRKAIHQAKVGLILYTMDREIEWLKRELSWMEERQEEDATFLIIPLVLDNSANILDKNRTYIDFTDLSKEGYLRAFNALVCAIKEVSPFSNCLKNEIKIPKIPSFLFLRKLYNKMMYFKSKKKVIILMLFGLIVISLIISSNINRMLNIGSGNRINNIQTIYINSLEKIDE